LDLQSWEDETLGNVFKVTLNKEAAEKSDFDIVWLKELAEELEAENTPHLNGDIADRLLIGRLELDPQAMSDDFEYVAVIASLPAQQTVFEYLVGCWKRLNSARANLIKKVGEGLSACDRTILLIRVAYLGISARGYSTSAEGIGEIA
jgi:ubiquitin conjugation factor E4 B